MIGSSGYLKEIPLPSLSLLEWPSVDDSLLSSLRYKLFSEMQLGMKEKGDIHALSGIFMPFSIFVHLFGKDESIRKTGKMYYTSKPSDELLTILFFIGWDRRLHDQSGEEIECRLSHDTLSFKYTFSILFTFNCIMLLHF